MKRSIHYVIMGILCTVLLSCAGSKPGSTSTAKTTKDYSTYANMYDLLRSVSGLTVNRSGSGIEVNVRGSQSITNTNEPLFVVNGMAVGRNFSTISHLDPVNVKDIRVQRGLAATNRWGSEGNSGAILITTKSQDQNK